MSESKEIMALRHMAWERVKGELNAILQTYWSNEKKHKKMQGAIDVFLESVENEGLQE